LEYLVDTQAGEIQELRDQLEDLRDWTDSGTNSTAVASLLEILTDASTTVRQKLRASNVILSYKVEPRIGAFVKAFLESVCGDTSILTDYRVEAAEQLRKCEGAPRILSAIERPNPAPVRGDPATEKAEREALHEWRRKHLEEQLQLDRARMAEEQLAGRAPRTSGHG
jgi:hypothetical protein